MDAPTDADLIRTSLREPRAFAGIFDRHFGRVRGYLGRRVEPEVAADLSSETFAIAFDARARFDLTRADAGPWLHQRRSTAASTTNTIAASKKAPTTKWPRTAR